MVINAIASDPRVTVAKSETELVETELDVCISAGVESLKSCLNGKWLDDVPH